MEKTIASKIVYEGKIIKVRVDDVQLGNGMVAKREVVEHPGAVAILALTENQEVFLVRQFRKPVEKELLEIPAGKLEPFEDPASCAARELEEEVGMQPLDLRRIAFFYSSPGFASETMHLFLATNLQPSAVKRPDDEILEPVRMPLCEAIDCARQGRIEDGKTMIALLLAAELFNF